jgi:hypothetical protein
MAPSFRVVALAALSWLFSDFSRIVHMRPLFGEQIMRSALASAVVGSIIVGWIAAARSGCRCRAARRISFPSSRFSPPS